MTTIYEYVLEAMVTPQEQEQTQASHFIHFLSSTLLYHLHHLSKFPQYYKSENNI